MFINDELGQIERGLAQALELLAPGGRLAAISFHSLEDRLVKQFIRRHSEPDPALAGLPHLPPQAQPPLRRIGRKQRASLDEIRANPRARSALLRDRAEKRSSPVRAPHRAICAAEAWCAGRGAAVVGGARLSRGRHLRKYRARELFVELEQLNSSAR